MEQLFVQLPAAFEPSFAPVAVLLAQTALAVPATPVAVLLAVPASVFENHFADLLSVVKVGFEKRLAVERGDIVEPQHWRRSHS